MLDTGFSPAPYIQYARGVRSNLDLGVGAEIQLGYSLFGYAKYAFFSRPKNGWSLAGILGAGFGVSFLSTEYIFGGPLASYRAGKWEYYIHPRANWVHYSSYNGDKRRKSVELKTDGGNYSYFFVAGGFQYYFSPAFAFGLGGVVWPPSDSGDVMFWPSINFLFRF
jgi:hypothetical protein